MTTLFDSLLPTAQRTLGSVRGLLPSLRWTRKHLPIGAVAAVFALVAVSSLAPPRWPTPSEQLQSYVMQNAQTLSVPATVNVSSVTRDTYSATPGIATLAAGGTNYDWAKLVMVFAGFPLSESNITVFTRWMRQENGYDNWWNRNNPLNNGWGSGGGGGTGSYDNLVIAAENAAAALHGNSGYSEIVAGFTASAPTEVIEAAIWASPWASGHYANGGHWAYFPVPVVKAPEGTWG
jgi:hypothetical protein